MEIICCGELINVRFTDFSVRTVALRELFWKSV